MNRHIDSLKIKKKKRHKPLHFFVICILWLFSRCKLCQQVHLTSMCVRVSMSEGEGEGVSERVCV